ncbi:lipid-transfer protein [Pseudomaricurvus alkylphenolicus]|uniref:lipid-transfer protein n=1 Tax=Pseudomaricurvus alkylphenolicus TaxID=1306991 RepID=UPI00141F88C5|nr:lipid-transfer protein [Pseudomaricurvus alkylphenolicus]NIB42417.1 lipid-transfer protein [Pseudomaricurvus alkylphenolicus]
MSRKVYVAGIGMGKFKKPGAHDPYEVMGSQSVKLAIEDAGIQLGDVQQAYASYIYGDSACGQKVLYELGLPGIPIFNVNNNCSSGSSAIFLARQAVESGMVDCALAYGFEQMQTGALGSHWDDRTFAATDIFKALNDIRPLPAEGPPAAMLFGCAGEEYMQRYDAKADLFAKVAVKTRRHAGRNPYALFTDPLTVEEVMASPVVFGGFLTRFMCCPPTCGAAAAVFVSEDFAKKHGCNTEVFVAGQGMGTDNETLTESACNVVGYDYVRRAALTAYEQAGLGPEDVDVVELHDCFTPNEVISYESLGLCGEGEAMRFVDDGDNTYGGRVVVNPSGGLMSKGHPIGATGLAQCFELVTHLRGTAGDRQVENARVALQHNIGVPGAGVVTIYQRS